MPQYERRLYEPSDDAHAFDSDEDMEDEGSRLPLLIGIALIVLLSFAGVVWLAYTQGVQRGRADAPQMAAAQRDTNLASTDQKPTPYSELKIYQPPKTDADVASDDPAPPPSTVTAPNISNATPPASGSKSQLDNASGKATETPKPPATKSAAPVAEPVSPPAKSATGAPRVITPSPTPAKPVKVTPQDAAPSTAKPSAKALPPKPAATSGTKVLAMKSPAPKSSATASKPIAPATSTLSPAEERAAKFIAAGPAASLPATTPATPATADAKPATADAKPATADAKSAGGGILLQIGSYKSDSEANASWQTYKGAHSSVAGYSSDVRKADLGGKGTWYRLRIGPFASLAEANAACAKLKAQGGNCFPARQ